MKLIDFESPFDFQTRTRIISGPGKSQMVGELAASYDAKTVLLVADPGIAAVGHAGVMVDALRDVGVEAVVFDDFGENPTSDMIDRGVLIAASVKPDLLVGLGGGSSLDCCKAINLVHCCGGTIHDFKGMGHATGDLLPMIAIPTTAGTGSEVQSFAIIGDAETHIKMPCGDLKLAPRIAILDPVLTVSQPQRVASLTGIDAISHALETFVTTKRNPMSIMFSKSAFSLLATAFPAVIAQPDDLQSRSAMQIGAALAGLAIESSMLGAAHATANPLTAHHDIAHGQAVGLMLPAVIEMNAAEFPQWYGELARSMDPTIQDAAAGSFLAEIVRNLMLIAGLVTRISELPIVDPDLDTFASDAMHQWTGTFNPVPLSVDRVRQLYQTVS